ncbi:ATP-dependent sacrificial sulfur transferase LarE [Clostridium merdae]|uniref:ATP-dependent sacrificial sulfur transferase LarE n=1 Tax=Clostridium merdae TaxID=1958780 RepID=UPI000A268442|nr:ATP-dependent sacrificial sulfur transferase LarE [Clostridium merdae]
MNELHKKKEQLEEYLRSLESVAVAFSGGVDSTFLLTVAHNVLGDKAVAVTARSCSFPQRELNEAKLFCERNGIQHIIVDSEELDITGFSQNPVNRCYLCKTELFQKIRSVANQLGLKEIVEGSNLDDNGDYRPGLIAVAEQNAKSPLRHCNLSKAEIRTLSKEMSLPTWSKPSFACLSSRFPYGETISEEKLTQIDKAEQILLDLGFRQVRVRHHGNLARIEVEEEQYPKLIEKEIRHTISTKLKELGFVYVSIDITGYRTGSMNETLSLTANK